MKRIVLDLTILLFATCIISACSYRQEISTNVKINGEELVNNKVVIGTDEDDTNIPNIKSNEFRKINFGNQDGEPISWYVISEDNEYQLLLSEKAIDTMPYNDKNEDVNWDKSTLYEYLNTDFVNESFSDSEINKMTFTNDVDNDLVTMLTLDNLIDLYGDIYYYIDGYYGNNDFYAANPMIIAKPTDKALYNEIEVFDNSVYAEIVQESVDSRYRFADGAVAYWVLNKVEDSSSVYYVTATGYIGDTEANTNYIGIRPIIRIKK